MNPSRVRVMNRLTNSKSCRFRCSSHLNTTLRISKRFARLLHIRINAGIFRSMFSVREKISFCRRCAYTLNKFMHISWFRLLLLGCIMCAVLNFYIGVYCMCTLFFFSSLSLSWISNVVPSPLVHLIRIFRLITTHLNW